MNNSLDRRGFLKAMLVLAGSVVAPGLISAGPRESVYAPKVKHAPLPVYGKAIPYSKEASILSQFDPDDPIHAALRKQMKASVIRAHSIWVAANGSDFLGTGDIASPFRTIGRAVQEVQPGGIVHLKPGVYEEVGVISMPPLARIKGANL